MHSKANDTIVVTAYNAPKSSVIRVIVRERQLKKLFSGLFGH